MLFAGQLEKNAQDTGYSRPKPIRVSLNSSSHRPICLFEGSSGL